LVFDVALDFLLQLYYYACSLACLLAKYTTSIIRRERERERERREREREGGGLHKALECLKCIILLYLLLKNS